MDGFCVRGNLSPTESCVFNRFLKRLNGGERGGTTIETDYLQVPRLQGRNLRGKKASLSSTVPHLDPGVGRPSLRGSRGATIRECQNEESDWKSKSKRHQGTFGKFSLEGLQKPIRKLHWSLGNPDLTDTKRRRPWADRASVSIYSATLHCVHVNATLGFQLKGPRHRAFLQLTFINYPMPEMEKKVEKRWKGGEKRQRGVDLRPSCVGISAPSLPGS